MPLQHGGWQGLGEVDTIANIVTHPSWKVKLLGSLNISIPPQLASKISAIADREEVDPPCLIMIAVARLTNQNWDWEKGKPRSRGI